MPARPLNSHEFDLAIDVAEQAALHFVKLLFGFRDEAQGVLQRLAIGAYERLVFQIIGRHFVAAADSNLPPLGSLKAKWLKGELQKEIDFAARSKGDEPFREGAPKESVIKKLDRYPGGLDREMLEVIVAGLIAGTVGNVRAAVPIVIYDFFTRKDDEGRPLIDTAREAARPGGSGLEDLILEALRRNPPAAFLTRASNPISKEAPGLTFGMKTAQASRYPEAPTFCLQWGPIRSGSPCSAGTTVSSTTASASILRGR